MSQCQSIFFNGICPSTFLRIGWTAGLVNSLNYDWAMVQCYLINPFNVWWPCSNISWFNARFCVFFASFHFSHPSHLWPLHGPEISHAMHCSVLRSWVEAEKLCAEEGLQLATPHSREDVKARARSARAEQCARRLGPKNGAKWTTRSDLGEEILFGDAVFHGDICW